MWLTRLFTTSYVPYVIRNKPSLFLATGTGMELTLGTNKRRSHDYLNYCEYPVHSVDPYIYLRLSRSIYTRVSRPRARTNINTKGSWYPGDTTEGVKFVVGDHDFIGTSQTTRDICSRTADALTIISLSLSFFLSVSEHAIARPRTRVCITHHRRENLGK